MSHSITLYLSSIISISINEDPYICWNTAKDWREPNNEKTQVSDYIKFINMFIYMYVNICLPINNIDLRVICILLEKWQQA